MKSDKDSLTRLIEDVDAAAAGSTCQYFREDSGGTCSESCPAYGSCRPCVLDMLEDAARRLHALMPHDIDGREIKAGDTIESAVGTQVQVTDVMPLPVLAIDDDGTSLVARGLPRIWRVVEPDSWERLEGDAALLPHDYLTTKDASDKRYGVEAMTAMAADLVRRAKKLAGVE